MEDDGDDKDDSKRRTRNLSEKKRRDQFNTLVNELSTMISSNNRKMDKSTVLKSAISFLKNHNEVTVRSRAHDVQEDWKPSFLANEEFTYLVLEAMEAFILVFSGNGRINYVSESIMSLLGHNPNDILNTNIFDLMPDTDKQHIYSILHHSQGVDSLQLVSENANQIRFQCHLKRGSLDFRDEVSYELIDFVGRVRTNVKKSDNNEQPRCQSSDASSLLFICTGKLHTPQLIRDVTLSDSNCNEFISRHSLNWKFLFLDHRAPPIIGYLPFEVLGTSGYDYYHFDDLENVINCHETLMQKGELTSCYYRFLTKGQQWIWLQTMFYITYHQWNSKPEFVVCTHRVVSHDEMVKNHKTELLKYEAAADDTESCSSQMAVKEPHSDDTIPQASPSYYSDINDDSNLYTPKVEVLSAISALQSSGMHGTTTVTSTTNTASASRWSGARARSDGASVSGESPYQQRDDSNVPGLVDQSAIMPQHTLSSQYNEMQLKTSHGAHRATTSAVLPPLPVIITHDHAHAQDELQRKHEQLQQMILQQQEELRQVKEQLMMARFGILNPVVPVQNTYTGPEEQPPELNMTHQVVYDGSRNVAYLPPPPPPPPPTSQGQHLADHHHPHMPQ